MTTPLYCLLFFAGWTLFLVCSFIAAYRVSGVLLRGQKSSAFPADKPHEGPGWYQRAQRAHMNSVENLPIFATLVVIGHLIGVTAPMFSTLAIAVVVARVGQSLAHISSGRALITNVRFMFFSVQVVAMIAMGALIVLHR